MFGGFKINTEFKEKERKPKYEITRFKGAVMGLIPILIMGIILFVSSGRLDWIMAWLLLGIHLVGNIVISSRISLGLINERAQEKDGIKNWDVALVRAMSLAGLSVLLVAGLDIRFGWTGPLPLSIEIAAMGLVILGYVILAWASITNEFFSRVVRIQEERGHKVIVEGPYKYIRHPGYLGLIFCTFFQPIMLGSLIALIPAFITVIILIIRTNLEDKTLQEELYGYKGYMGKVKYRLFLGIW